MASWGIPLYSVLDMASPGSTTRNTTSKRLRRTESELLDITNMPSTSKRASYFQAGDKLKELNTPKAPRGRHVLTPPSSPSASLVSLSPSLSLLSSTPHNLRSPSLPPTQHKNALHTIFKKSPYVIEEGMNALQSLVERNTTFAVQKAMALQMFGAAIRSGVSILEACNWSSVAMGFSAQVIRRWAQEIFVDFFSSLSSLEDVTDEQLEHELESARGRHPKWITLSSDENFRRECQSFIHQNANVKGKPNLTLMDVVSWVKSSYGVDVCKSTVSLWLHDLGFSYQQHSKGVYFDGHDRADVVTDRTAYLQHLESLESRMWLYNTPSPNPAIKPVIRVYHDESTYYANSYQSFHWTDGSQQVLKQKSLGQAIMVSDFVEEVV